MDTLLKEAPLDIKELIINAKTPEALAEVILQIQQNYPEFKFAPEFLEYTEFIVETHTVSPTSLIEH